MANWFQEARERSDRIGYVLTRFSRVTGRFILASRKVYHDRDEAAAAASRRDKGGLNIWVDLADKFGVAPEEAASARQPRVKQKPFAASSCPLAQA